MWRWVFRNLDLGTSLVVQWLRLRASNAGDKGSVLGLETKIPHAAWRGQKRKRNLSLDTKWSEVKFALSCPTLCDPMNRSTPGHPVQHQLPEFTQTHVHRVSDAIQPSVVPFSSCPQSLPASVSFPMSQIFAWGGQSVGVSASASVLPMNTQDWSSLGWTGWISLLSKGLSRGESPQFNHSF